MLLPEEFEKTTISKMLAEHPQLGEILTKHHIDCAACGSSSCLFKNVIATHTYNRDKAKMIEKEIIDYLSSL